MDEFRFAVFVLIVGICLGGFYGYLLGEDAGMAKGRCHGAGQMYAVVAGKGRCISP